MPGMSDFLRLHRRAAILLCAAILCAGPALVAEPVRVIFDTDIGNDVDDALALAILHGLESRGEAKILAVTITKDNKYAASFIDCVNTFYGRPGIPIGVVRNGKTPEDSAMIRVPATRRNADGSFVYAHRITDGGRAPDAVSVLRSVLEKQPDASVVFIQVGFSTNLARLLEAAPDLVARKVRLLSAMAGSFPRGDPEDNVKTDIPAARRVFRDWPSPIVFSGFEIGQALLFPAASIEHDFAWAANHPVAEAYRNYMPMPYDRPTWDLTAALYGVRADRGYFSISQPGTVDVDDEGRTVFTPNAKGTRRYLILEPEQKARVLEALILLASQPRQDLR